MRDSTYRLTIISCLIIIGILLYIKTLNFPFVFDGHDFILKNPLIRDLDYFEKMLDYKEFAELDETLGFSEDITNSFFLRPVTYLTFSINYLLHGYNSAGFRSFNIAIHISNALLVYLLIEGLLTEICHLTTRTITTIRFIPALTALIFLVHPLQTESVTYITQRFASLAATFYLAPLLFYFYSVRSGGSRIKSIVYRCLSFLFLLCGMFVKESLFTAPVMLVLMELVVLRTAVKVTFKRLFPFLLCMGVIPTLVLLAASAQNHSPLSLTDALDIASQGTMPTYPYAITQLCVLASYLRLMLLPYGQNLDPDYPLYTSLLQGRVLLSIAILMILCLLASNNFRKHPENPVNRLILFGLFWYFITISVSSSIVPLPDLMAEHHTYLPSVGIFTILACMIDKIRTSAVAIRYRLFIIFATILWSISCALLTSQRNEVWRSRISLWQDTVQKSPLKARPWLNLGMAHLDKSHFTDAIYCFKKVISLDPNSALVYVGLSTAYYEQGLYHQSIEASLEGLRHDGTLVELYQNLGASSAELGLTGQAEKAFQTALKIRPDFRRARASLALLAFLEGDHCKALQQLKLLPTDRPLRGKVRGIKELIEREASGEACIEHIY